MPERVRKPSSVRLANHDTGVLAILIEVVETFESKGGESALYQKNQLQVVQEL